MLPAVYTSFQAKYFAHFLTRESMSEGQGLAQSLSAARVDLNPHQVDAALFALRSPLSKGVLLADEVGLGKTIEAALVMAQRWWERRRLILLIAPASLRKQWAQELQEKFALPSIILDAKRVNDLVKAGEPSPLGAAQAVIILSYEYAARISPSLRAIKWDLVVFDEAHKLRNVYKAAENSRAALLRDALLGRQKLLLTATPLQNNLMELFGLVSIIDDTFFGSQDAFRAEFGAREDRASQTLLGRRLAPMCKRTLRRQVQKAGLINYTNRLPKTFDFTPDQLEVDLYNHMSDFLQGDSLAVGKNGRHLVTLVLRKILGSSSFAVAATLTKMIARLERKLPIDEEALDDIDGLDETTDEWREAGQGREADAPEVEADAAADDFDPKQLKAEIELLKRYRELASSIQSNAKGKALVDSLPGVLDEIATKGGQRKAVIFTESVRTQTYLREMLEANGFAGHTVVLNGSNSDPDSKAIYRSWLERHRGTEAVSNSKTADMKAAIVEAFKDDRSILIATESGAEGINLQFCSLLINYDLPWNPQRVEQRIGRCHRYGQKIDVTVVNFMNRKNQAEERIVQLLDSKFRLFEGVFGSSDEVLGVIESGVDIERRILDIVQSCRGDIQINAAFDALQLELALQIDEAKTTARDQLLATMDDKVVQRLKLQKGAFDQSLDDFKRALLRLARAELPEAHFHSDHAERFDLDGQTYTTEWPLADNRGWAFFRLGDGRLADELVRRAKERDLPEASLDFDLAAYSGNLADLPPLRGKSGWMQVSRITLTTPARTYDDLVVAAVTDDGEALDPEVAERLLQVPAKIEPAPGSAPTERLQKVMAERKAELMAQAQTRLGGFLEEEEERLDNWREDARVALQTYARQNEVRTVHPFMLVVAQDTDHARRVRTFLESDGFFEGRYKGRVAEIHSKLTGEESDDNAQRLLNIERNADTDIVVHVNKLKEGWDVANLFTIVPLRASASDILTEQTLGRGLRLPYGKRTGVEAVDTLTVIAHDRFNDLIEKAKEADGVIHALKQVRIGEGGDVPITAPRMVEAPSVIETMVRQPEDATSGAPATAAPRFTFSKPEELALAQTALANVLPAFQRRITKFADLNSEKVIQALAAEALAIQSEKEGLFPTMTQDQAVAVVTELHAALVERTIAIPELIVKPRVEVSFGFRPFTLEGLGSWNYQPVSRELLLQQLRTEKQTRIAGDDSGEREERLEDYLVKRLIDLDEVDYQEHATLLYDLAGQVVSHFRGRLGGDEDVRNVLVSRGKDMAQAIFTQMRQHMWRTDTNYRVTLSAPFTTLRPQAFDVSGADAIRDFRQPPPKLSEIKRYVFNGFKRGCYWQAKFDSDTERQMAVLLEQDDDVHLWMKPGPGQFKIYDADGGAYQPDFVVETAREKLIIETKRKSELEDLDVRRKAKAAVLWCMIASKHAATQNEKPWRYLLVPEDAVQPNATLDGLARTFTQQPEMELAARYELEEAG